MEHISSHFSGMPKKRERITERGELMQYFLDKLNYSRRKDGLPKLTMGRMGRILVAIPTKDLYYLKSVCDQAPNFSKKFWWEVDPKKHEEQAKEKRATRPTPPQAPRPAPPAKKVLRRAPRSLD